MSIIEEIKQLNEELELLEALKKEFATAGMPVKHLHGTVSTTFHRIEEINKAIRQLKEKIITYECNI